MKIIECIIDLRVDLKYLIKKKDFNKAKYEEAKLDLDMVRECPPIFEILQIEKKEKKIEATNERATYINK